MGLKSIHGKIAKQNYPKFKKYLYPTPILSRKVWNTFSTLRIGHCLFSHKHIIEKNTSPFCDCGQNLNVSQIFNEGILFDQLREQNKLDRNPRKWTWFWEGQGAFKWN